MRKLKSIIRVVFGLRPGYATQLSKEKSQQMNTSSSRVKRTDFYEIISHLGDYIIIIGDTVAGAYTFSSMEEAEEYVIWNYEELASNCGVMNQFEPV